MKTNRLKRILGILSALQAGCRCNIEGLARLFGTSRRTILRDLRDLQAAGVPFRYDWSLRTYVLERRAASWVAGLDQVEAEALLLLARTAGQGMHMPFARSALLGAAKLERLLSPMVRRACYQSVKAVSCSPRGQDPQRDLERPFSALRQAITARRLVRLRYQQALDRPVEQLEVCPLHLYYDHPQWYLIARDLRANQFRPLRLTRILDLEVLNRSFVEPATSDLLEVLKRAWSARTEGTVYHVRLRFSPKVADQVTDIQWHHSQQVTIADDGSALVSFEVDGLAEITNWVLSFGDQVQVLGPEDLRNRVLDAAKGLIRTNARYRDGHLHGRAPDCSL